MWKCTKVCCHQVFVLNSSAAALPARCLSADDHSPPARRCLGTKRRCHSLCRCRRRSMGPECSMMHGNWQRLWPRPSAPLWLACSWLQSGWQVDGDGLDCTGPGWAGKTDGTHWVPSLPIHAVFGAVKVKNGAPAVETASGGAGERAAAACLAAAGTTGLRARRGHPIIQSWLSVCSALRQRADGYL